MSFPNFSQPLANAWYQPQEEYPYPVEPGPPQHPQASSSNHSAESRESSRASQPPVTRHTRTRKGCLTCRSRKVRCDETHPNCKRCAIGMRTCAWAKDPRSPGIHATPAPTPTTNYTTGRQQPAANRIPGDGSFLTETDDLLCNLLPAESRMLLFTDPSLMQLYFPSTDEKLVIHHYLSHTIRNIVAIDDLSNPWTEYHAPMAFLFPRGRSIASDALQLAMLSVGSIHLRCLTPSKDSAREYGRASGARVLGMVKSCVEHGAAAEVLDVVLAALLSCVVSSTISGNDNWQEIIALAATLIDRKGGIEQFLSKASRDRQYTLRFLMEQFATRDVFGCLTTGKTPVFLSIAFSPWFFEAGEWGVQDDDGQSIEKMFGVSRGMVDLMARVCAIIGQKREKGYVLREVHDDMVDSQDGNGEDGDREFVEVAANDLLAEIEVWKVTSHGSKAHPRVKKGVNAHVHALIIHILANAFDLKHDIRMTRAAEAIMALCSETVATFGRVVWLTWPVLMAGLHVGKDKRESVLNTLRDFAPHAFIDNQTAIELMHECWRRQDRNEPADWWSLIKGYDSLPFFD